MKILKFKQVLPTLFKANIVPLLWGNHGRGKTESVGQVAKATDRQLVILNLGTQEVGDLLGLPDFSEGKTSYRVPDWFPTDPHSKGILFLDEINRARRDVLQAVFSLVLEKRLHTARLPEGWNVVAAANPYNKDYVVTDISDKAFMSRFCHIKVESDVNEWAEYASTIGVSSVVKSFVVEHKSLFSDGVFSLPSFEPDLRGAVRLDRVFQLNELEEGDMLEVACGVLGQEAGVAFMSHKNEFQSSVKGTDVLNNFAKVEEKLVKLSGQDASLDMLNLTCNEIIHELKEMSPDKEGEDVSKKPKKSAFKDKLQTNVYKFIKILPKDLACAFILKLVETGTSDMVHTFGEHKEICDYFQNEISPAERSKVVEAKSKDEKKDAA